MLAPKNLYEIYHYYWLSATPSKTTELLTHASRSTGVDAKK
jgi:hypothetical protein